MQDRPVIAKMIRGGNISKVEPILPLDHIGIGIVHLIAGDVPGFCDHILVYPGTIGAQVPVAKQDQDQENNSRDQLTEADGGDFQTFEEIFHDEILIGI